MKRLLNCFKSKEEYNKEYQFKNSLIKYKIQNKKEKKWKEKTLELKKCNKRRRVKQIYKNIYGNKLIGKVEKVDIIKFYDLYEKNIDSWHISMYDSGVYKIHGLNLLFMFKYRDSYSFDLFDFDKMIKINKSKEYEWGNIQGYDLLIKYFNKNFFIVKKNRKFKFKRVNGKEYSNDFYGDYSIISANNKLYYKLKNKYKYKINRNIKNLKLFIFFN